MRQRKTAKVKDGGDHIISSSQKEANRDQNEAETYHMTNRDQNEAEVCHMISKPHKKVDRSLTVTDIQGEDVCLVGEDTDDVSSDDDEEEHYDINDNKDIMSHLRPGSEGGTNHKLDRLNTYRGCM